MRPGTDALLLIGGAGAEEDHALWLPGPVHDEVRYGAGAYVFPLMDLLDEWEPLALAFVEKDQARLITAGAGCIREVLEYHSEVPGRHKQGKEAERRWERHTVVHIERHLEAVAKELNRLADERQFRRLFLAGPVEAVSRFRADLPQRLLDRIAGELPIDAHATPDGAVQRALPLAREVERREEEAVVEELATRAEKGALAVTGADATLAAVNRHQVYKLVMSADTNMDGRYCMGSRMLFGPKGAHDEQCVGPVRSIWLRQEVPCYALSRGVAIEVVHADAARRLNQYGGLGGFLESPRR